MLRCLCCYLVMAHFFHAALFPFWTFCMLQSFHVAFFFLFWADFMSSISHFFRLYISCHVALFLCFTFFISKTFLVTVSMLPSVYIELSSCCTLSCCNNRILGFLDCTSSCCKFFILHSIMLSLQLVKNSSDEIRLNHRSKY